MAAQIGGAYARRLYLGDTLRGTFTDTNKQILKNASATMDSEEGMKFVSNYNISIDKSIDISRRQQILKAVIHTL